MNGTEEINLLKSILFSFILIIAAFFFLNAIAVIFVNDAKIIFLVPIIQLVTFIIFPLLIIKNNNWSIKYNLKLESRFKFSIFLAAIAVVIGFFIFNIGFNSSLFHLLPSEVYDKYNDSLVMQSQYFDKYLFHNDLSIVVMAIIMMVIIAPISEEILFRGFLQTPLENCISIRNAIALSAALFALIHFNFAAFPTLFILGLILGYFAYHTQNIIYPIIIHILNNLFAFIEMQISYNSDSFINNINLNPAGAIMFVFFGAIIIIYSMHFISENSKD